MSDTNLVKMYSPLIGLRGKVSKVLDKVVVFLQIEAFFLAII